MTRPRNIVGPVLRSLREELELTQPMLVARLNLEGWDISRETLAKIETQVRWVADWEVMLLARALKTDAGAILNRAWKQSQRTIRPPQP